MNEPQEQRQRPKPSIFRTVKAVAWSFVGLRARGDFEEDIKSLSLIHIIVVAIIGIFLFVAALMLLVKWAVAP